MMIISDPKEQVHITPSSTLTELGFDPGEISLLTVKHFKSADKFTVTLWELMAYADATELEKLHQIYPEQVSAYQRYKTVPGWYDLLLEKLPQRRLEDMRS